MGKRGSQVMEISGKNARLVDERRGAYRTREKATIEIQSDQSGYRSVPLIEYTELGARVVLSQAVVRGQSLDLIISTEGRTVRGEGRIAWASPLSTGRSVAGIELIQVTSVLRRAV